MKDIFIITSKGKKDSRDHHTQLHLKGHDGWMVCCLSLMSPSFQSVGEWGDRSAKKELQPFLASLSPPLSRCFSWDDQVALEVPSAQSFGHGWTIDKRLKVLHNWFLVPYSICMCPSSSSLSSSNASSTRGCFARMSHWLETNVI